MAESTLARLAVIEYRDRHETEWDSLTQCAMAHGISIQRLKMYIHVGGCPDGHSKFDLPTDCPYDTRLKDDGTVEIFDTRTQDTIEPIKPRVTKHTRRTVAC